MENKTKTKKYVLTIRLKWFKKLKIESSTSQIESFYHSLADRRYDGHIFHYPVVIEKCKVISADELVVEV